MISTEMAVDETKLFQTLQENYIFMVSLYSDSVFKSDIDVQQNK